MDKITLIMKKILDILKYKLGWQTYKDAFFWTFVSIWFFVAVVTFSCIYDNPNIDWEFTMHLINFGFIWFFACFINVFLLFLPDIKV